MNERLRRWTAVAVVLIGMLASGAALGQDPDPCHEAYLQSGLTEQQLTFDDFHRFYGDTLCAPNGDGLAAIHADRLSGGTR